MEIQQPIHTEEAQPPGNTTPSASPLPQTLVAPLPGVGNLLRRAWSLYKSRLKVFLGVTVIPTAVVFLGVVVWMSVELIPMLGLGVEEGALYTIVNTTVGIITFLAGFVIQLWGQTALLYAIKDSGEGIGVRESYRRGWRIMWSYLWVAFLVQFVTTGGVILLVVPGILFAVWFSMAIFVLVGDDIKGMGALLRSYAYVRGRWWRVTWFLVFISLLSFVAMLIPAIPLIFLKVSGMKQILQFGVSIVVAPLTMSYLFLLYGDLKATVGTPVYVPKERMKTIFIVIGVIGATLIPLALLSTLAVVALGSARVKARDAQVSNDLRQIQTALLLYSYDVGDGKYPTSLKDLAPTYLSVIPVEPMSKKAYSYTKVSDTDYQLCASFEAMKERCVSSKE